jgi:flagellar hook-basal body complex protein FliE
MNMTALSQWFGQMMPSQSKVGENEDLSKLISGQSGADASGGIGTDRPASGFANIFAKVAQGVGNPQAASEKVVNDFGNGSEGEIHQNMMTLEKGDISFKFFMTAKNKCIEAYKEITRMG